MSVIFFETSKLCSFFSYLVAQPSLTAAVLEQDKDQPSSSNLPALIPSASLVLNRTQMTLGLLRDVVQESSAEYWYRLGRKAGAAEDWDTAIYALEKFFEIQKDGFAIEKLAWLAEAYDSRSIIRASQGNEIGSLADRKASNEASEYLDYLTDMIDGMSQYND